MDDDALRRGRPTVHVRFGEAIAMLTGDALQPLAFDLLSQMPVAPALIVQATRILARAAGSQGMAGGQAIDCESVGVRSEEHTSELQSLMRISYAVFCLKKKNKHNNRADIDDIRY